MISIHAQYHIEVVFKVNIKPNQSLCVFLSGFLNSLPLPNLIYLSALKISPPPLPYLIHLCMYLMLSLFLFCNVNCFLFYVFEDCYHSMVFDSLLILNNIQRFFFKDISYYQLLLLHVFDSFELVKTQGSH